MGTLKKLIHIVPDELRPLAGNSEIEWTIDGEKVNCGSVIQVVINGKTVEGRFELDQQGPYLAGTGVRLQEDMEAHFKE